MMIKYIILVILLAAKCSCMPPTYPIITKPVQTSYSQKLREKGHQPSVKLKTEPVSTPSSHPEITDPDEIDPFSNEEAQFAPLPFKLKDKKMMSLLSKDSSPKTVVALEYEGSEDAEGYTQTSKKKTELEPLMDSYRGPKVYSHFIPGHNIRAYNYDVTNAKLAEENEKLENIFRQYINFENEWKRKHVPKLAMFNVAASLYTPDDERFEMDIIAETTSQAPPPRLATRPKLRFRPMNIIRDFKSNRVSHVAPAAGLLRMVAHPVGHFKLGKKELSKLRNRYFGRT